MRQIHKNAWLLVLLSAALQILSFPLPGIYVFSWVALAPLIVAIFRARTPETIQLDESQKLIPATPLQGFLLGYLCGVIWYIGTCYWVYDTMHQYGGLAAPIAAFVLLLFALYLGLYQGAFALLLSLLARKNSSTVSRCFPRHSYGLRSSLPAHESVASRGTCSESRRSTIFPSRGSPPSPASTDSLSRLPL